MTGLDSFSTCLITNVIKEYFEYIDECFSTPLIEKTFVLTKDFIRELFLPFLVKLLSNDVTTMIIKLMK